MSSSTRVASSLAASLAIILAISYPGRAYANYKFPVECSDGSEEILDFWRKREPVWPRLAQMARDVLAVPETSVGVERMFNMARDICHYRRGHLKPEAIRDLMILKHFNREALASPAVDLTESEREFREGAAEMVAEASSNVGDITESEGENLESNGDGSESEDDIYSLPAQAAPHSCQHRPGKRPHSQI